MSSKMKQWQLTGPVTLPLLNVACSVIPACPKACTHSLPYCPPLMALHTASRQLTYGHVHPEKETTIFSIAILLSRRFPSPRDWWSGIDECWKVASTKGWSMTTRTSLGKEALVHGWVIPKSVKEIDCLQSGNFKSLWCSIQPIKVFLDLVKGCRDRVLYSASGAIDDEFIAFAAWFGEVVLEEHWFFPKPWALVLHVTVMWAKVHCAHLAVGLHVQPVVS